MKDEVAILDLSSIAPPKGNPRTHFNQDDLAELAESIRQHGVLQPILVRPDQTARLTVQYELVAGERRYRAAKIAELSTIPAMIRDLDDRAVLEVQVVENLIREGLHPLEEAEGYRRLIDDHGYRVEDLVLKIGKSRSYVYSRMKLADIPDVAREAMWKGTLSHSTALLVARIPDPGLKMEATKQILKGNHWETPMSYRESLELIKSQYMLKLAEASFPIKDKKLLPKAGSCVDCPKRTGNQRDLFPDIKSADVCTDPGCFKEKQGAHWKRAQEKALAAGKEMVPKGDADVVHYGYTMGNKYIDLKESNHQSPKKETWKKLLGKDAPQVFVAKDCNQKVHELVLRKDAEKVIKKKYKWESSPVDADQKQRQLEGKVHTLVNKRVMEEIGEAAPGVQSNGRDFWHVLALCAIDGAYEDVDLVAERRGLKPEKQSQWGVGSDYKSPLIEAMDTMTAVQLRAVALEVLTAPVVRVWDDGDKLKARVEKFFGVNRAAITRKVKAELTKSKKPATKKQKKKAQKGATQSKAPSKKTPSRASSGSANQGKA